MIPERFRSVCSFCLEPLDIRAPGVHKFVQGWVKNRTEGGSNAVVFPMVLGAWACQSCIDTQRQGTVGQSTLFG